MYGVLYMNSTCFVATVGKTVHLQWTLLVHYSFSKRHGLIIHSFVSDLSLKTYSKLENKIVVSEIFSLFLVFFQILLPWKVSFRPFIWLLLCSINTVFLCRCKTDVSLKHIRILEFEMMVSRCHFGISRSSHAWVVLIRRALDLWLSTCPIGGWLHCEWTVS